mmetsp:Transcript_12845/g.27614  ORF Transcript_12845/g.27614 Transcript_12845/m.27614 type:complete len:81 (+) Transcript_12845:102-344(+)
MYLTQLTFIDDGNQDVLNGCMLNVNKHTMTGKILLMLQRLQASAYEIDLDISLNSYLRSLAPLSEDECYRRSLQYEQRQP